MALEVGSLSGGGDASVDVLVSLCGSVPIDVDGESDKLLKVTEVKAALPTGRSDATDFARVAPFP